MRLFWLCACLLSMACGVLPDRPVPHNGEGGADPPSPADLGACTAPSVTTGVYKITVEETTTDPCGLSTGLSGTSTHVYVNGAQVRVCDLGQDPCTTTLQLGAGELTCGVGTLKLAKGSYGMSPCTYDLERTSVMTVTGSDVFRLDYTNLQTKRTMGCERGDMPTCEIHLKLRFDRQPNP